jgi:hypothetical protein
MRASNRRQGILAQDQYVGVCVAVDFSGTVKKNRKLTMIIQTAQPQVSVVDVQERSSPLDEYETSCRLPALGSFSGLRPTLAHNMSFQGIDRSSTLFVNDCPPRRKTRHKLRAAKSYRYYWTWGSMVAMAP